MAKYHGRNTRVYLNGYDIGDHFNAADISNQADQAEVSAFSDTDKSYVMGLKGGNGKLTGFYDSTAAVPGVEAVLASLQGAAAAPILSILASDALGERGHSTQADEISLSRNAPIAGVVTMAADFQGNKAVHTTKTLLAKGTLGTSTSPGGTSAAMNGGNASAAGAVGYLHAFSIGGGTPVLVIEHSATGTSAWATLLTFAGVASGDAPQAQKVSVSGTVQPYKRVTASGGTGVFWVGVHQPPA